MEVKRKMCVKGVARLLVLGVARRKRQLHFPKAFPLVDHQANPKHALFFHQKSCSATHLWSPQLEKSLVSRQSLSLCGQLWWGYGFQSRSTHGFNSATNPLLKGVSRRAVPCFPPGSFCYSHHNLEILTRPSAVIKTKPDGLLLSTCTNVERAGSYRDSKDAQRVSTWASSQSASALSEFLCPLPHFPLLCCNHPFFPSSSACP